MTSGVLVLGGGVAGIQAALDLADAGIQVYLVERSPSIGGNMIRLDKTFPTNDCSSCILSPRLVEAGRHPRIKLLTNSDMVSLEGDPGAFTALVRERPRYIDMNACVACGDCTIKCPVKVPSEFDEGLSKRKAVYIPFPQAVPLKYVIDPKVCLKITKDKCGLCEKACQAKAVNYDLQPVDHKLDVGAVVVATGYKQIDTSLRPEYGHGRFKNVITGMELERLLNASGPTGGKVHRPSDGSVPKRVAFIHCALSRDERRGAAHCSRVCCMYTAKHALLYKHKVH
ncbi:MAG: CoB--CoM heterodisulfide reductase iron-sulfur subunit A family protein, partial [Thermoplasmata archaeon]|nr:CoB--CoM heterodisulfide reductase iron-sulfur subunit A family protein [Thermoplasmata archaeon]